MGILTTIITAGELVGALSALGQAAAPMLEQVDTDAITEAAADVAKKAAEAAADGADKAKGAFDDVAKTLGGLADKAAGAKDRLVNENARKKAEKDLERAIREVRQSVLENATTTISVADLLKAKEKAASIGPINTMPGCFVIATYRKMDFDKDLTDYLGIYVGKAENASSGVEAAISREGDPDVYADVKYKQNVHVFVYNCLPEDLEQQYAGLCQTFSDAPLLSGAAGGAAT